PTKSESTTSEVNKSSPKEPDECVKPMALSADFRFLKMCISPRPQTPPSRFLYDVRFSNSVSTLLLFGSEGSSLGMYEGPASPKTFSTLMFRSNMNPSKFECATLPLNSRIGVRRGQIVCAIFVPSN